MSGFRTVIHILVFSILGVCGLSACTEAGQTPSAHPVAGVALPLTFSSVSFEESSNVPKEHCRFTAARRDTFGAGRQVLIHTGSTLPSQTTGLCTVDEGEHTGNDSLVLVHEDIITGALEAAAGTVVSGSVTNEHPLASAEGFVAEPLTPLATRISNGVGLGEYWRLPAAPAVPTVAWAAPHGGEIEPGTDEELAALNISATDTRNAYWGVIGDMEPNGAADHWHITAGDVSEFSFEGLQRLRAHSYTYAVSFHGFTNSQIPEPVLVGGAEALEFRQSVASVLEHEVRVRHNGTFLDALAMDLRDCDANSNHASCKYKKYGGRDEDNFVNELPTSGRGLQLEQTTTARNTYGGTLARGVKSVLDCLLDAPDRAFQNSNPAATSMSVDDTGLILTTGACPYFVGELEVLHGAAQRWAFRTSVSCGTGSCTGLLGRVDAYGNNADGTWTWVGGGELSSTIVSGSSRLVSDTTLDHPASTSRRYRFVVRASNKVSPPAAPVLQRGISVTGTLQ
ncbi:poly-gamma-glutamate hydrolase family protein [Hyalangium sp.]|uniref:poly-gamma-glutamate hydrolase family protein n=1 Tax=Hyalangium sp. TaxID=2028555 RepID=UPI002D613C98|nr:poly-gamma-glutamate hydrolase family protein [Hyalangium sp.]HYI00028.1 poly-gamma-glutamate hydrolase family protein [Hyalangium sp.]